MLWSGLGFRNRGHFFSSKEKLQTAQMQSAQSPPQSLVKRIRAYGNALNKCHTITITINIQLEYEMIRSKTLADAANSVYSFAKEFLYDHVMREEVVTFKKESDARINLRVNPQRRSLKGILLLFVEPYTARDRDSEKYIYPDLTKVSVTVNGSPNMLYINGIGGKDFWEEAYRFFKPKNNKKPFIDMTKFYTNNNFGLLRDQSLHSNGTRLVNTKDCVQLELEGKPADQVM